MGAKLTEERFCAMLRQTMAKLSKEERAREERLSALLVALVRAYHDRTRPAIRERGIDERDLAFEAGLLSPAEVDTPIYATRKRNTVLSLLREMRRRQWADIQLTPPQGVYHVILRQEGIDHLAQHFRPWWARLREWLQARLRR
jgi:hypothetical protein